MKPSKRLAVLALVGIVGLAACGDQDDAEMDPPPSADAQQTAPAEPQQEMDPEMAALMTEVQQLQQRLAPIQQQAMQDEELSAQLEELREQVESEMREENEAVFVQMQELESEYMAAQEAGDQERLQAIGLEARSVETEFRALQEDVLDRPDVRERVDAYEQAERERMIEIDPEAGEIMDRISEILAELGMG